MLAAPSVVAHSKQWPWTPGQNLLLYEDPDYNFVINATVRKPGTKGAIHDHGHSWTLYGLIDGTERIERYTRLDDGKRAGYGRVREEVRLLLDACSVHGKLLTRIVSHVAGPLEGGTNNV